ncbi:hypothetical protein FOCC_FOCC001949 [Frankliniella occidentalis]|nr:hypothetical protein FOCC_FOCC001949 [Frankliniella occidentalis]
MLFIQWVLTKGHMHHDRVLGLRLVKLATTAGYSAVSRALRPGSATRQNMAWLPISIVCATAVLETFALDGLLDEKIIGGTVTHVDDAKFMGPYIAYSESVSQCADDESTHESTLFVALTPFDKSNPFRLQKLYGNVTMKKTTKFNDEYWVRVRLDSWSINGWKENAFIFNFPTSGCSVSRHHMPGVVRIVFGEDFMKSDPCHLETKNYTIPMQYVNWTFPHFPVMPYGHWRFHLTLGHERVTGTCVNVVCHTIPKPKVGRSG